MTMKDRPNANFPIEIHSFYDLEPEVGGVLSPDDVYIQAHPALHIALVRGLPHTPWPPFEPSYGGWRTPSEVAIHVFRGMALTISSTPIAIEDPIRHLPYGERSHTAVWIEESRYLTILADVQAIRQGERIPTRSDIAGTALSAALEEFLPQTKLSEYQLWLLERGEPDSSVG